MDGRAESWPESPVKISAPAHLKYFGYAAVDSSFDDPHNTEAKTNYLDEVADFANIAGLYLADDR